MNLKKALLVVGLMGVLTIGLPANQVLGVEPPDPGGEKIVGPEMWAVGVVDCSSTPYATLRVKKIEGCNVDTDPQKITGLIACPANAEAVLWHRLPQGSVFGLCDILGHEPIITKVKNYKEDGDLISFDAQIKFVVPETASDTVCTPLP